MIIPSRKEVEFLRETYRPGQRVVLEQMGEDPQPIMPGTKGTVQFVDDVGNIAIKWDNGRSLNAAYPEDKISKIEEGN